MAKGLLRLPKELMKKVSPKVTSFVKEVLENKIVLYVVAFFALTNVLGYAMFGKNVCVLLFVLIAYAMTYFTKNMVIVLAVPIVMVGFFSVCKVVAEKVETFVSGMTKVGDEVVSADGSQTGVIEKIENGKLSIRIDPISEEDEGDLIVVEESTNDWMKQVDEELADDEMAEDEDDLLEDEAELDDDAAELVADSLTGDKESFSMLKNPIVKPFKKFFGIKEGMKPKNERKPKAAESAESKKKAKSNDGIDTGATIEAAYENVQEYVTPTGLAKLTEEAQGLMKGQENIMNAVEKLQPMMDQATALMKTMDASGIGEVIAGLGGKKGSSEGFTGCRNGAPLGAAYGP